ncbi:peptidoglycan-binding protein [Zobellella denitrificans]|uniref:Peptidoglycan-binding protein n=1 Tax=Zobellella denitrificans TaxID=347534 RepID=A0A291HQK8_9GAMM|nr:glycosyl hydrolase 108 family protein [Zobellella denitrificans]ATG74333.1 peptidoglycan-binding protein [Zobellella denitrificans]ATG74425.1 peptidoglycan-binding protein [Zobellella denitrificans]
MSVFAFNPAYGEAFRHGVTFILAAEGSFRPDGGYIIHPNDPGGETKHGISKRAYPHEDIKNLSRERAVFLYHRDYWKSAHCHEWQDGVSLAVLDAAVQHGYLVAIKLLQEVAGVKPDGLVGPKTRAAVTGADPEWLIARLNLRRARLYARILRTKPAQGVFIEGWHNRLRELTDACWQVVGQHERRAA